MKKLTRMVIGLVSLTLILGSCGRGKMLVKVGGETITESDLEVLGEINPRLKPQLATPAGREKILENYIEQTLLYREALRRGLHRVEQTRHKVDLYKRILIAQAVLDDELNKKVREYYDTHKDEFERVRLSHILIRTVADEGTQARDKKNGKPSARRSDAEALKLVEKVKERLAKGEDFAKVASELSEDARSKMGQGDLGTRSLHDKGLEHSGWSALAERAFAMKEGEISEPIKSGDGYHLVKVVEGKKPQPLDEADPGIRFQIQGNVRTLLLEDLKKKFKVQYVAPSPPPTNPPPAKP